MLDLPSSLHTYLVLSDLHSLRSSFLANWKTSMQGLSTSLMARDDGGRKGRRRPPAVADRSVIGAFRSRQLWLGWDNAIWGRDIYVFQSGWLFERIASGQLALSTPLQSKGCPFCLEWFSVFSALGSSWGRRTSRHGIFLPLHLR
jgi:hypothetical protein